MIKYIVIALVLIIGLSSVVSADYVCVNTYSSDDGYGTFSGSLLSASGGQGEAICFRNEGGNPDGVLHIYFSGTITSLNATCSQLRAQCESGTANGVYTGYSVGNSLSGSGLLGVHSTQKKLFECGNFYTSLCGSHSNQSWAFTVSTIEIDQYKVSGNRSCSGVDLYQKDKFGTYTLINTTGYVTESTGYEFPYLLDGRDYRLSFAGHDYDFTCTEDEIYNYDACTLTLYNFKEACENLILDSEGFYIEKIGSTVHAANNFYASSGVLNITHSPADNIYVSASPFSGQIGWFLDPIINDTTYTLTNPIISWSLKVIVQNGSTGDLIDDAMVKVNQSCYCTDGYSIRQKLTTNGHADFTDMSLQDAGLFVMKTGYKILDETSTGYAAFLSGRANFSSKTWIVKLAPSWSENESTFYESNNTVNIFFKNKDGNRTSKILDTDSEIYLYYENNNTDEEDMTLKFQSSSTHTYFIDEQSWNIPYGEIGHKTILNTYFTPWDYSYRAVIYNSSIYGWNMTIPLTVRNATKEENQHYENLSTDLWFMYADTGKIDYRNDMDIGVHACSNNTTLMYVDIELYKDNVLLYYKNMTASNFINADFSYYYVWGPAYSYESGSNYSVRMYGFDRTLLETDYVDCYTDDITRKNKLTIIVKNHYGTNLDNAFVYLEDYGSIPTGTNYYTSFEGLNNGYYRFKATKPDYIGTGWSDITISDSDEIVTYTLTSTDSEEGSATQPQKMDENELQNIYLIIMAFLLIFIIIGGLKYAL